MYVIFIYNSWYINIYMCVCLHVTYFVFIFIGDNRIQAFDNQELEKFITYVATK